MRGVWQSPQVYFPLYADWDTLAYLGALGVRAVGNQGPRVAVLVVYSAETIHFRLGDFVFLSTGLIIGARSERELIDAIQTEFQRSRGKMPVGPSACVGLTLGTTASFSEVQQRLAAQVAEYARRVTPRLKRREELRP